MIAVIKGDIIASRKLENQALWLRPLKSLLTSWGKNHKNWELHSGDLKEAQDRKLTEYILIGTLLSFGIAIAVGMLVIKLIQQT